MSQVLVLINIIVLLQFGYVTIKIFKLNKILPNELITTH
jgi:hypothetical protein